MANIVGQMFFRADNGARDLGWSEDHYIIGAGDDAAAIALLETLAEARSKLLGAGAVINYLRVSDIEVFRDSQVVAGIYPEGVLNLVGGTYVALPFTVTPGDPESVPVPASPAGLAIPSLDVLKGVPPSLLRDVLVDQPQVGFLVRLEAGSPFTNRRSLVLRGMPDGVVNTTTSGPSGLNGVMSANWLKQYLKWQKIMLGGKFGFRCFDPAVKVKPITAWTYDGLRLTMTATIPGLAAVAGDKVRISEVKIAGKKPGTIVTLHGDLVVATNPVADVYYFYSNNPQSPFTNSQLLVPPPPLIALGVCRKLVPIYVPYVKMVGRRWGERKCGIPFDPSHGRVRARR